MNITPIKKPLTIDDLYEILNDVNESYTILRLSYKDEYKFLMEALLVTKLKLLELMEKMNVEEK